MWSNSVSKEELKLLDILSDSMINLNYGELCSMMTDQHSITAEAINKLKQLLLSGELKLSPQDPAPIVVSDKVQGVASEEARNEQEKQPEQNFMVAQSRISSEKRK